MELKSSNYATIKYHDIFDYPLTIEELSRWRISKDIKFPIKGDIQNKKGYFFLKGRESIINIRLRNEKSSKLKLKFAKDKINIISKIPLIKFIGITGALSMNNANNNGDIDLLIITQNGALWTTRLITYLVMWVFGIKIRSPKNKNEKDRFCLNMWMDEKDLEWDKKDRNIYTAHEILQIVPIFDKGKMYEYFLFKNNWALKFWPKANVIVNTKNKINKINKVISIFEKISYFFQYRYMKSKISREVTTPTRAIFHPNDWGKIIISKMGY